jgi:hypothetical protein
MSLESRVGFNDVTQLALNLESCLLDQIIFTVMPLENNGRVHNVASTATNLIRLVWFLSREQRISSPCGHSVALGHGRDSRRGVQLSGRKAHPAALQTECMRTSARCSSAPGQEGVQLLILNLFSFSFASSH